MHALVQARRTCKPRHDGPLRPRQANGRQQPVLSGLDDCDPVIGIALIAAGGVVLGSFLTVLGSSFWNDSEIGVVQCQQLEAEVVPMRRLPRNQLDVLVLLVEADREVAGIEVADAIAGLRRSSAYAALAALQRDGMVSARWDIEGSHPRRMFRVTRLGQRTLTEDRSTVLASTKLSVQGA